MLSLKKVINYLKSFLIAPFILFLFDKMAVGIDVFIPINLCTLLIVGFLEIPGLIMLIIVKLLFF